MAFDILLDLIIKSEYYTESIYCIDEPETHLHTKLQADLLEEMYIIVPGNSQLWITTHSLGMMRKAKELNEKEPGSVAFIDFSSKNFDVSVNLQPVKIDKAVWDKFMSLAIDEYSGYIAPSEIVFCEGESRGRISGSDADCFSNIFGLEYPETAFYSLGSCSNVLNKNIPIVDAINALSPTTNIRRVIDRDDRSSTEIGELKEKGIKVFSRRTIESFLLDDEVIEKLCEREGKLEKFDEIIVAKNQAIQNSISRGNPQDDIKSAAGDTCNQIKKILALTGRGNNTYTFMRDSLAPLITDQTEIYKQLKADIFGEDE